MGCIEIKRKKKGRKGHIHKSVSPLTDSVGALCCGGGLSGLRLLIIYLKFQVSTTF